MDHQDSPPEPKVARQQLLQPNHKLTGKEIEQLAARYEAGASLRALSRQFRVHEQTVRAHLKRHGVVPRSVGRLLTADERAELIRFYLAGRSTYRLAKELGVSPDTVRRVLIKVGVRLRGRTDWRR